MDTPTPGGQDYTKRLINSSVKRDGISDNSIAFMGSYDQERGDNLENE